MKINTVNSMNKIVCLQNSILIDGLIEFAVKILF